jgi:uncharacterized protein YndB with AHSA1/START domain
MAAQTKRSVGDGAATERQTIHHTLQIAAPPARVFAALTEPDQLAGWWTTQVHGNEPALGATLEFTFRGSFQPCMRIVEFDPPARLAWTGVGGHAAWGETDLRFELEPANDGTLLQFWHYLGPERSEEDIAAANCNWGYYMDSLRRLCETGRGKPYQPGMAGARVGADPLG